MSDTTPTTPTPDRTPTADLVATFVATFASDASVDVVVTTYRPIPAASRGGAITSAMLAAVASGMASDTLTARLDAINNMPTATAARVKTELSDSDKSTIKFYAWTIAASSADVAFRDTFGGDPESNPDGHAFIVEHATVIDAAVKKAAALFAAFPVGDRTRTVLDDTLTAYVPAGSTIVGTYKNTSYAAVVNDDGTVTGSDGTTGSISTVATKLTGQKAVNGWRFFTYGDRSIAAIRSDAS